MSLAERVTEVYKTSVDIAKLEEAWNEIYDSYLNQPYVISHMKNSDDPEKKREYDYCEGLCFRIGLKTLLLKYVFGYTCSDNSKVDAYNEGIYDTMISYATSAEKTSLERGYPKTRALAADMLATIPRLRGIIDALGEALTSIYLESGEGLDFAKRDNIESVISALLSSKTDLYGLNIDDLFPSGVVMPGIREKIESDIDDHIKAINAELDEYVTAQAAGEIEDKLTDIADIEEYLTYKHYSSPYDPTHMRSRLIVASSPLDAEISLFAVKLGSQMGCHMKAINLYALKSKKQKELDAMFDAIIRTKYGLLVTNLERMLNTPAFEIMAKGLLKLAAAGNYVVIMDNDGDKSLYEAIRGVQATAEEYSMVDTVNLFLSMPRYEPVLKEFLNSGVIEDTKDAHVKLRLELHFMGYIGYNKALMYPASGFAIAKDIHEENSQLCKDFLRRIDNPVAFIDMNWGSFSEFFKAGKDERGEINYDEIAGVDPENIKIILEPGKFNIFEQVGLVVKYCTLAGEDTSAWSELSSQDKEQRLSTATQLIAKVLECHVVPKVYVLEKADWKHGRTTMGVCMENGARIEYNADYLNDYNQIIDTVCHEVFHNFQHTAVLNQYRKWYDELWVDRYRIAEWAGDEGSEYISSDEGGYHAYRVQVLEADAHVFSGKCIAMANAAWNKIKFKTKK